MRETTTGPKPGVFWVCVCDCGNTVTRQAAFVVNGHNTSCGCALRDRRHGLACDKNGDKTRLYSVWTSMRSRCNNTHDSSYPSYGGRGIRVCDEWESYPAFYRWAMDHGYDPLASWGECTLDRIDVDGNYAPQNCRWVNMKIQANNKRPRTMTYIGNSYRESILIVLGMAQMALDGASLSEISEKYHVSRETVRQHLLLRSQKETPSK